VIERLLQADDVAPSAAEEVALFDPNAPDFVAPIPPTDDPPVEDST
jgi:hypothetical protein